MKNAITKVTFIVRCDKNGIKEKLTMLSKEVFLPELNFLPKYIRTQDGITFCTEICEYNTETNQLLFVNYIDYQQQQLDEYKKFINNLLQNSYLIDCEQGGCNEKRFGNKNRIFHDRAPGLLGSNERYEA